MLSLERPLHLVIRTDDFPACTATSRDNILGEGMWITNYACQKKRKHVYSTNMHPIANITHAIFHIKCERRTATNAADVTHTRQSTAGYTGILTKLRWGLLVVSIMNG